MTNIREVLALNLKKHRQARGWSQAKLAEKVGTSTHYIGMLETKTKFPSGEEGFQGNAPLKTSQCFGDTGQITVFDKKLPVFSG